MHLRFLLLLSWGGGGGVGGVFLNESGLLRDHVGDTVGDGVSDAQLLIDQLVGLWLVPVEGHEIKINK